jgi:hypothetical protein
MPALVHPAPVTRVFRVLVKSFPFFEIEADVGAFIKLAIITLRANLATDSTGPAVFPPQFLVVACA